MKKILKKLRYNFYISTVLKLTLVPIYKICAFINFRISRHILINSGTVEYDGYKLSFPKNLGVNYISSLFWNGDDGFEKDVWKTLKPLILKSNYFFDIGSNIGFYSVLAKKANANIKVAAFEPIESIYNKNLKFHKANNILTNEIKNMAISDKDGTTEIYLPDSIDNEEETTATLDKNSWQHSKKHMSFSVKTRKLDSFVKDLNLSIKEKVVIKIDIEGFELYALKGAEEMITKHKPYIVCEILSRKDADLDTFKFMENLGYQTFAITADGLFKIQLHETLMPRKFRDFLFAPKELKGNYYHYSDIEKLCF